MSQMSDETPRQLQQREKHLQHMLSILGSNLKTDNKSRSVNTFSRSMSSQPSYDFVGLSPEPPNLKICKDPICRSNDNSVEGISIDEGLEVDSYSTQISMDQQTRRNKSVPNRYGFVATCLLGTNKGFDFKTYCRSILTSRQRQPIRGRSYLVHDGSLEIERHNTLIPRPPFPELEDPMYHLDHQKHQDHIATVH